MTVTQDRKLSPDGTEAAWQLYAGAMAQMVTRAAQRHLLNEYEFAEICADERLLKFRARDTAGHLGGLSTLTSDLTAWPLIEPGFFAHHWPDDYARSAIWYVGFVATAPGQVHAFSQLVLAMFEVVRESRGMAAMDYSTYNLEERRLAEHAGRLLLRENRDTHWGVVDAQHTVAIRFDGRPVLDHLARGSAS